MYRDDSRLLRLHVHFDLELLNELDTENKEPDDVELYIVVRSVANLCSTTICLMGMDHVGNKPES